MGRMRLWAPTFFILAVLVGVHLPEIFIFIFIFFMRSEVEHLSGLYRPFVYPFCHLPLFWLLSFHY